MSLTQTDIVIVGAGPIGMSLFLALSALNYNVIMVDQNASPAGSNKGEWDARNYALTTENVAWLSSLGVENTLSAHGTPMDAMHVVYEAGSAFFELSAHQVRQPYLAWMLRHDKLCQGLWERIQSHPMGQGIEPQAEERTTYPQQIWQGVQLRQLQWSSNHIHLHLEHQGQPVTVQAKLIIGADGAQSWVRSQTQVPVHTSPYSHQALVGCFETEHPHGGTAYQWFKRNGEVMAWLPMPQGVGVVWSHPPHVSAEWLHDSARIADELSHYGERRLGRWRYQGGLAVFPLSSQQTKGALPPRVMLIGDSRQRIHPLAGQGLNLGLMQAQQLVQALAAFPLNDPGHEWIRARLAQQESLAQRLMPWGVDALWHLNQPGFLPEPFQKLIGIGWRGFHQSGMLKHLLSQAVLGKL